jgi:hypothetical protein
MLTNLFTICLQINFQKPLDKPGQMWYNNYRKGEIIPNKKKEVKKNDKG